MTSICQQQTFAYSSLQKSIVLEMTFLLRFGGKFKRDWNNPYVQESMIRFTYLPLPQYFIASSLPESYVK